MFFWITAFAVYKIGLDAMTFFCGILYRIVPLWDKWNRWRQASGSIAGRFEWLLVSVLALEQDIASGMVIEVRCLPRVVILLLQSSFQKQIKFVLHFCEPTLPSS